MSNLHSDIVIDIGDDHLVSGVDTSFPSSCWQCSRWRERTCRPPTSLREVVPIGRRGCVGAGEALDPEAPTPVPPGLRQGRGLAHEPGVPSAVGRVVVEFDRG